MTGGLHPSRPAWKVRPTRSVRILTILGLAVAIGMLGLGAGVLFDARQDAWRQAVLSAENLTLALEREIARSVSVYDLSLQGAIDAWSTPGINEVTPELRHAALFDRAASAEYLGSLLVLDRDGSIVADSTAVVPHRMTLADRDYFQVHRDHAGSGMFLSRPFRSRLRGGSPSISISRRLQDREGRFDGIVVGTIKLAYFQDILDRLNLASGSTALLERTDGRLVVRRPSSPTDLDRDLGDTPLMKQFAQQPAGGYQTRSRIDGVDRWVTYRQVGTLPLVLAISTSMDAIYAPWWQKAISIGSILLVLSGTTVVLILLFRREIVRRLQAEGALVDAASKLSIIAATDGLTGLSNRRAFEAELQVEWKRAARAEMPLALLMLDADFFKAFNDRYGHVEGDQVLRQIATSIERAIRRPGDVGARYGGEEFVALLPETELAGAMLIAQRICTAVAALRIQHEGSPSGHVSVSIGVAVARPWSGDPATSLVREADQALYIAKRDGRGRVAALDTTAPGPLPTPFAAG